MFAFLLLGSGIWSEHLFASPPPAPVLRNVSPASHTAGHFTIDLYGNNFQQGARVLLRGSGWSGESNQVRFDGAGHLQASVDFNSAAALVIAIRNPDGQMSNTVTLQVTAMSVPSPQPQSPPSYGSSPAPSRPAAPVLRNISPFSHSTGRFSVDFYGSNFEPGARIVVMINGHNSEIQQVQYDNSAHLSAVVDVNTAGGILLTVHNPDGQISNSVALQVRAASTPLPAQPTFSMIPAPAKAAAPVIRSISPSSHSAGRFSMDLYGASFEPGAKIIVTANGNSSEISQVTYDNAIHLQALFDFNTAGTLTVAVRNPDGQTSNSVAVQITSALAQPSAQSSISNPSRARVPAPVLLSLTPSTHQTGHFKLDLNGNNFQRGAGIVISGAGYPNQTAQTVYDNTGHIQAVFDLNAAGAFSIAVRNPDGQSSSALPLQITGINISAGQPNDTSSSGRKAGEPTVSSTGAQHCSLKPMSPPPQPTSRPGSAVVSPYSAAGGNPFDPTYWGNCTWYAWGRASEVNPGSPLPKTGLGNAGSWISTIGDIKISHDNRPAPNSLAVWDDGALGHVAYIEAVDPSGKNICFSEANVSTYDLAKGNLGGGYDGYVKELPINQFENRNLSIHRSYLFKGYIHLPLSGATTSSAGNLACSTAADAGYSISFQGHTYKVKSLGPTGPAQAPLFFDEKGTHVTDRNLLTTLTAAAWTRENVVNAPDARNGARDVSAILTTSQNLQGYSIAQDAVARALAEALKAGITGGASLSEAIPSISYGMLKNQLLNAPKTVLIATAHHGLVESQQFFSQMLTVPLPQPNAVTLKAEDLAKIRVFYIQARNLQLPYQALAAKLMPTRADDLIESAVKSAFSELLSDPSLFPTGSDTVTPQQLFRLQTGLANLAKGNPALRDYSENLNLAMELTEANRKTMTQWIEKSANGCR